MKTRLSIPHIIGKYRFSSELGHGGFAYVYKAKDLISNKDCAIKIIPKTKIKSKREQERFQREINITALFKCDNIVQMKDFFCDENNYYMVLELCKGGDLYDYLLENDRISESVAAQVFRQIVNGLNYSHSLGVAHRDIKPQNILITEFPSVKIADFGLCEYVSDSELIDNFCGSPMYCSPECLTRCEHDPKIADIWSLGVLLYTICVGNTPWETIDACELLQSIYRVGVKFPPFISKDLQNLLSIMLKINPTERATIREILDHQWLQYHTKLQTKALQISKSSDEIPYVITNEKLKADTDSIIYSPLRSSSREQMRTGQNTICLPTLKVRKKTTFVPKKTTRNSTINPARKKLMIA